MLFGWYSIDCRWSLQSLLDYLVRVDSDIVQLPACQLCQRKCDFSFSAYCKTARLTTDHRMKPTHTRGILPCGHHFHTQCLPGDSPSPACPLCKANKNSSEEAEPSISISSPSPKQQIPSPSSQASEAVIFLSSSSTSGPSQSSPSSSADLALDAPPPAEAVSGESNEMHCED